MLPIFCPAVCPLPSFGGNAMIHIRRSFLQMAGATLALPAISRICNAQPSQGGPKLNQLLTADLQRQGQTVQETEGNLLEMAPSASAPWHMHPGAQEIIFIIDGKLEIGRASCRERV